MAVDLVDLVMGYLTPEIVHKASGYVGESSSATQMALTGIAPTLVSALANKASTSEGAQQLIRLLDTGKDGGGALRSATDLFAGGMTTQSALSARSGILDWLFGSTLGRVSDLIAHFAGIRTESASSLLALTAPLVMHVLGQQRASIGPHASSLASLLESQKSLLRGALPAGLGALLAWPTANSEAQRAASAVPTTSRRTEEVAPARPRDRESWFAPLLLLGALALGALIWLSWPTRPTHEASPRVSELQLPRGVKISVAEGSLNFNLVKWLAGNTDTGVPKRFLFENLNFESDSTRLTPESVATVNTLMAVLSAYPAVSVALEGYTDNTGDPSANQKLSDDRAGAVKDLMVKGGIADSRITATGYGQDKPIASNDTEQGRAKNRRLELVVLKR